MSVEQLVASASAWMEPLARNSKSKVYTLPWRVQGASACNYSESCVSIVFWKRRLGVGRVDGLERRYGYSSIEGAAGVPRAMQGRWLEILNHFLSALSMGWSCRWMRGRWREVCSAFVQHTTARYGCVGEG